MANCEINGIEFIYFEIKINATSLNPRNLNDNEIKRLMVTILLRFYFLLDFIAFLIVNLIFIILSNTLEVVKNFLIFLCNFLKKKIL